MTCSKGSRLRSARLGATTPSVAATTVTASWVASRGFMPPMTNSSVSRWVQVRKIAPACSSSCESPAATVTASTAQPADSCDRSRSPAHRSRKRGGPPKRADRGLPRGQQGRDRSPGRGRRAGARPCRRGSGDTPARGVSVRASTSANDVPSTPLTASNRTAPSTMRARTSPRDTREATLLGSCGGLGVVTSPPSMHDSITVLGTRYDDIHSWWAMTELVQFTIDERAPGYWRVVFSNPPINLLNSTTVLELAQIVERVEAADDLRVAFRQLAPRLLHGPLRPLGHQPRRLRRPSPASPSSSTRCCGSTTPRRSPSRRSRSRPGGGTSSCSPVTSASRAGTPSSANPRSASASCRRAARSNGSLASSVQRGRSRSSPAATTTTLRPWSATAGSTVRFPTPSSMTTSTPWHVGWRPSTSTRLRQPSVWFAATRLRRGTTPRDTRCDARAHRVAVDRR